MPQAKLTARLLNTGRSHWLNVAVVGLLTVFGVSFSLANLTPVSLQLLGVSSQPVPLYVPIFVAFLLGFSGGMLSLSFSRRKHKQEIEALRKDNDLLQREVENLRNIPLQDDV